MSETKSITLADATNRQLLAYAQSRNLDVAPGANNKAILAKILQADPALTHITVEVDAQAAQPATVAGVTDQASPSIPSGQAGAHWKYDPVVMVYVFPSNDPTRPKDVQIAVNGDAFLIKRGEQVNLPYRFFLALDAAKEDVARDLPELNPATGLPLKEWTRQHSYPFSNGPLPSDADIAAWQERTGKVDLKRAA